MSVNAQEVKELRDRSGCGMMAGHGMSRRGDTMAAMAGGSAAGR